MEIVKSAEARNVKVSRIVANVEDLAEVVLTLAGKVVKSAEARNVKVSRIVANVEDLAEVVLTLAGKVG